MKINPQVPIELDKPRLLWLNFNAMVKYEEQTGKNVFKSMSDPSVTDLRALIWACLLHEDPKLTIETVGEFINMGNMEQVMDKLMEAWVAASPDKTEKNEVNLPNGTG